MNLKKRRKKKTGKKQKQKPTHKMGSKIGKPKPTSYWYLIYHLCMLLQL